jgi:hypothetical protein
MESVPGGLAWLKRLAVSTLADYVAMVHADIDAVFSDMEANPQMQAKKDEDQLTHFVAFGLKQLGYRTKQGAFRGGSVDLTVEGRLEYLTWTAEAKIYRKINDIVEGFLQLTTRYRPGSLEAANAGMLIYVPRPRLVSLMDAWKQELLKMGLPEMKIEPSPARPQFSFFSEHAAEETDLPFRIRHMAVSLYQQPRDKSGRSAKKHNRVGN